MKNWHIILAGFIPVTLVILFYIWGLILDGFTEASDITPVLAAIATGGLLVALGFIIKFIIQKFK